MFRIHTRPQAVAFFVAFGIASAFLMFLAILFGRFLGALLMVLIIIVALGLLRRGQPRLFELLKREGPPLPAPRPPEPLPHPAGHRTYMMLIGLSVQGSRISVNTSPFVIGSSEEADFCLSDSYVSGRHAILEYDPAEEGRYVTDASRNGTYVNSRRLPKGERTALHHGDTLQIGDTVFSVEYVSY